MPKINVYLPDELAAAVREAELPVSSICQVALEAAVRDVAASRATDQTPEEGGRSRLFARFTPRARHAVERAQELAGEASSERVETEHVLLGILDEPGNLALTIVASLDVEPTDLRAELVASIPTATPSARKAARHVRFSKASKRALEASTKEALAFGHNYIGCEHLLLGLLAVEEGVASDVMRRMGLELRTTRRAAAFVLAGVVQARLQRTGSGSVPTPGATNPNDDVLGEILRRLDAIERRLER